MITLGFVLGAAIAWPLGVLAGAALARAATRDRNRANIETALRRNDKR
jgi:membrane protein YqaA with SNARE-associated domain